MLAGLPWKSKGKTEYGVASPREGCMLPMIFYEISTHENCSQNTLEEI